MKKWRILQLLLTAATLGLMTQGCTRGHYRATSGTVTPGLTAEERKHGRNGTNPNAPFTLVSRDQKALSAGRPSLSPNARYCAPEDLGVVEVAERVNGDERYVNLAFVNEGARVCKIGGYPVLSLLDEHGESIESISVTEVKDTSQLTAGPARDGSAALPVSSAAAPSASSPAAPIEMTLAPQGEAYFGISWTTGTQCPLVSGLTVRAPGIEGSFSINHPLSVCSGQVRVTALRSTQYSG